MPIVNATPAKALEEYIEQQLERLQQSTIRSLRYVGEAGTAIARANGSYKDQTGNLRSSVGYVVVENGRIVETSQFNVVNGGQAGAGAGEKFAQRIAKKFPQGLRLIQVAGMDYAAHVKNRGFDVLDSAELTAEQLWPKLAKAKTQGQ